MDEYIKREALEKRLNDRLAYLWDKNGPYDHCTDGGDEAVRTEEKKKYDPINHPKHYCRDGGMECLEEMELVFGHSRAKQDSHQNSSGVWRGTEKRRQRLLRHIRG